MIDRDRQRCGFGRACRQLTAWAVIPALLMVSFQLTGAEPLLFAMPNGAVMVVESEYASPPTVDGVPMTMTPNGWWRAQLADGATVSLNAPHREPRFIAIPSATPVLMSPSTATTAVVTTIAIAGRWNWPDAAAIGAAERAVGRPISAVVAVGDAALRFTACNPGVPILCAGSATGALAEVVREQQSAWNYAPACGALAFPRVQALTTLAEAALRPRQTWRLPVLSWTPWDDGSRGRGCALNELRLLAAAAQAVQVPMVLSCGSGSGLLSHPLGDIRQARQVPRVGPVAGGPRYLLVDGGSDLSDRIRDLTAIAWEEPLLITAEASDQLLTISAVDPLTSAIVWRVTWDAARREPGWGFGSMTDLGASWRKAAAAPAATQAALQAQTGTVALTAQPRSSATAALVWSAVFNGETLNLTAPEVAGLLAAEATPNSNQSDARQLLRRLADPPDDVLRGHLRLSAAAAPSWLQRELILRAIAHDELASFGLWADLAQTNPDPSVVAALLRRNEDDRVFEVLLKRVLAHSNGRLPLDRDPVNQHRLIAVISDDPRTGNRLRQGAAALLPRLSPLARAPLERYLQRSDPARR